MVIRWMQLKRHSQLRAEADLTFACHLNGWSTGEDRELSDLEEYEELKFESNLDF